MATNARPLKAYIRWDGQNRIIAGSLVLRNKIPKNGHWTEISAYLCCTTSSSTTA